jgi:hypothetical protein
VTGGLGQPSGEVPALGVAGRRLERLAIAGGRLGVPLQAAQRIGAGGEREMVAGECSGGFQRFHRL